MMNILPFTLPIIPKEKQYTTWSELTGAANPLLIHQVALEIKKPLLLLTSGAQSATEIEKTLRFLSHDQYPIVHFSDWETLPYDHFSPDPDIVSSRLKALYQIPHLKNGIIIASAPTTLTRLCPPSFLLSYSLILKTGDTLSRDHLRDRLIEAGYRSTPQVEMHGEFATRGSLLDLFPMGSEHPFRIEFFDDDIASIRSFDPETQRTLEVFNNIELLPAREYPLSEKAIQHFRGQFRERFPIDPREAPLYRQISDGQAAQSAEYYLPLFFESLSHFFHYLPNNTILITCSGIEKTLEETWDTIRNRYEQLRHDLSRPLCAPHELFLSMTDWHTALKNYSRIEVTEHAVEKNNAFSFHSAAVPNIALEIHTKDSGTLFKNFVHDFSSYRILLCAESSGRRESLIDVFKNLDIHLDNQTNFDAALKDSKNSIKIVTAPFQTGALFHDQKLALLTETEIFGHTRAPSQQSPEITIDPSALIRHLTELKIHSPVVHLQYGIGRYLGLQTLTAGNIEAEYIVLEYADQDKIYVPVDSLHLISRYRGPNTEDISLHRLGSQQWEKSKKKALEEIRDTAAELLELYGKRHCLPGHAFAAPNADFKAFRQAFPFEETPDQRNAINAIIQDMTAPRAMDRLVCGDVGFGKTEVAMQAAFLAVQDHKQVAVLVPTTLLAQQHLENFKDRFANWPIKIAGLSRMRSSKEQQQTIKGLLEGTVDIVIGTHQLLSEKIQFKQLGLVIIDEEHRFGVRQKERLKTLRANVDLLTLTATPIPRTLNMVFSGARDFSMMTTPPAKRRPIKTFIYPYQASIIREAILRELFRGGQAFFLHNEVETIQQCLTKLQNIVPEAKFVVAHGQMRERELEQVMTDFYHQRFHVLVCTTIVESGIDIPTANTILINRADRFGLAQLHQLRGRVGRSHHQAYAYLLTSADVERLTADAEKRLQAIAELGDLGIGFSLASQDLEIRGAGELLGESQSGHIESIGYTLYMELLEEAVRLLKAGKQPTIEHSLDTGPEIKLGISSLLPSGYISDVGIRLTLYKRLSECKDEAAIHAFKAELIDRFGPLPKQAENLIATTHLKLQAILLGIKQIELGSQHGYLHFSLQPNINPEKMIMLIQKYPQQYQLQGPERLRFSVISELSNEQRLERIQQILKLLT